MGQPYWKINPHHQRGGRRKIPVRGNEMSWFRAFIAALPTLTVFPPPSELPDISWRGQGRDMRKLFLQVGGVFDAVYREHRRDHAENR